MSSIRSEEKYLKQTVETVIERIIKKPLFDETCIFSTGARLLGDKWTIIVLVALLERKKRYSELQKQIPTISPKMLGSTLKRLEQMDLVARTVYAEVPPRVEYQLTQFGTSLRPVIALLCEWSVKNETRLKRLTR